MAAPMQKIARTAFQCFSRKQNDAVFQEHLKTLRVSVNSIKANDLGFDPLTVRERRSERDAPVTYVHIFENDVLSMGIFVLKPGSRLPMHDHPGMFGLCKVIHGSVHVKSFSECSDENIPKEVGGKLSRWQKPLVKSTILQQDRTVGVSDECCVLTPGDGNIHELKSVGGMAAFLDILAPPYNHNNRDAHYFKEMTTDSDNNDVENMSCKSQTRWLIQIPQPNDYWCDSLDYMGPPIDI